MALARSTICTYGDSGSGKTTLVESLAKWLYTREKKITRLISGDGGRWDSIQHLVDAGIVEAWDISTHVAPFETIQFASMGYWPKDANSPTSELEAPNDKTWERVGAVVFEGLTGFGSLLLGALTDRGAKGEKIGADAPARFSDGKTWFGSANMTYYGIVQRRLQDAVDKSRALPVYVYWTALQMRATDMDTALPIFGPELVGKAKTGDVPRWFANTLNIAEVNTGKAKERRLYITTWFDQQNPNVPHLCKNRIPAVVSNGVPEYIVLSNPPPRDKSWGLGEFLDLVERKQGEGAALYATKK